MHKKGMSVWSKILCALMMATSLYSLELYSDEAQANEETNPTKALFVADTSEETSSEEASQSSTSNEASVEATSEEAAQEEIATTLEAGDENSSNQEAVETTQENQSTDESEQESQVASEEMTDDSSSDQNSSDVAEAVENPSEEASLEDQTASDEAKDESSSDQDSSDDSTVVVDHTSEEEVQAAQINDENSSDQISSDITVAVEETSEETSPEDQTPSDEAKDESSSDQSSSDDSTVVVDHTSEEEVQAAEATDNVDTSEEVEPAPVNETSDESSTDEPVADTSAPSVEEETTTPTVETHVKVDGSAEVNIKTTEDGVDVTVRIAPDTEVLISYGEEIIKAIEDSLQWKDIPVIMDMSAKMLSHFSHLSTDVKRECLIEVLNYVIDHTDTPWLPDRWSDPFFKSMVPPFAYIFITDDFLERIDFSFPEDLIERKDYAGVAELIRGQFADGFQWSDLTYTIGVAFTFGAKLDDLSWEDRGEVMKQLIDYVVDHTDTPWLPDNFSDPIFKSFAHTTINVMINAQEEKEKQQVEVEVQTSDV